MSGQNQEHLWYYMKTSVLGENQEGPLQEQVFLKLATTGEIDKDTKISSPTRTKGQWISAQAIPSLMAKINEGKLNRKAEKIQSSVEKKENKKALADQKSEIKLESARQKQNLAKHKSTNNPYRATNIPNASRPIEGDATGGLIPYKNPKALFSYYIGIASLLIFPLGFVSIVLGFMGLAARKQNPVIKGSAHALIGIIFGGLSILCQSGIIIAMVFFAGLI